MAAATWEAKVEKSLQPRGSRPAWAHKETPPSKNKMVNTLKTVSYGHLLAEEKSGIYNNSLRISKPNEDSKVGTDGKGCVRHGSPQRRLHSQEPRLVPWLRG